MCQKQSYYVLAMPGLVQSNLLDTGVKGSDKFVRINRGPSTVGAALRWEILLVLGLGLMVSQGR